MATTTLVFKPDPLTGSAVLETNGLALHDQEVRELREEIKRRYPRFVNDRSGETGFSTRLRAFPADAKFRFTLRNPNDRSPDVVFEPTAQLLSRDDGARQPGRDGLNRGGEDLYTTLAAGRGASPCATSSWECDFLQDLDRIFSTQATAALHEVDRRELQFVIQELRDFASQRPKDLAPLLLAGYVSLAERMAFEHDPQRAGIYGLAARGIDKLFESLLPKPALQAEGRQRNDPLEERLAHAIRIEHLTRFLARCLGIPNDLDI